MWVHLFYFLLVGLKICSAARLLPENKKLYIAPPQYLEAEVAGQDAAETKPRSASENNPTKENPEKESLGFKVQRLSTSQPSPGVGHMQVSRIPKSVKRGGMSRMHEERVLESSPSPGVGN
ncbi:hypothetical protein SUGI_0253880 [Cryptomeria japonica]|nr:hypothetical protein SUGI_0253880 [Cryptomeria japonica]